MNIFHHGHKPNTHCNFGLLRSLVFALVVLFLFGVVGSLAPDNGTLDSEQKSRSSRSNFSGRTGRLSGRVDLYVGIAAPVSNQVVLKAFNRTLANVSAAFAAGEYGAEYRDVSVLPFHIELPENERFSANLLMGACSGLQHRRTAGVVVVGRSPAASTAALAAARSGIPVLRTSPSPAPFRETLTQDIHPLEVRLETTARETLQALRSLLLHTHWHSYTLLADHQVSSSLKLRKDFLAIIDSAPLSATILTLPHSKSEHFLFRRLADVSRTTRGVIVLICDSDVARKVLEQAKRLNMLAGHFVWVWIDTAGSLHQIRRAQLDKEEAMGAPQGPDALIEMEVERRTKGEKHAADQRERHHYYNSRQRQSGAGDEVERFKRQTDELKPPPVTIRNNSVNNKDNERTNLINQTEDNPVDMIDEISVYVNISNRVSENDINVRNEGVESSKIASLQQHYAEKADESSTISPSSDHFESDKLYIDSSLNLYHNDNLNRVTYRNVNNEIKSREELVGGGLLLQPTIYDIASSPQEDYKIPTKRSERFWSYRRVPTLEERNQTVNITTLFESFPVGLLALRPLTMKTDRQVTRGAVRSLSSALRRVLVNSEEAGRALLGAGITLGCWDDPPQQFSNFSTPFVRELKSLVEDSLAGKKYQEGNEKLDKSLVSNFEILNLVPDSDKPKDSYLSQNSDQEKLTWRSVGHITGRNVQLETIVWPGGDIVVSGLSAQARSVFRIVTALAPPFVMESELDEDGQCLRGVPCHRVLTSDKDNLTLVFNEMETQERLEEEAQEEAYEHQRSFFPHIKYHNSPFDDKFLPFQNKYKYRTNCCYGLTMDLLENIAQELEFDFHLYIVSDGLFGTRKFSTRYKKIRRIEKKVLTPAQEVNGAGYKQQYRNGFGEEEILYDENEDFDEDDMKWNGIVGDLVSGAAHMSFAALSVSNSRSEVIDFSSPYFFSGVSFLAAPQQKSEIPLLAFLLPFSPELWIAIFTSLNVTAIVVAIYEWLSPFGLNPWGRQRSKNFSMSSALWVMWGLLCGHLVAFKAPKSWPNKFLINVWGGFSVIFVASYTANIAALIAGLFFHNSVENYHDRSLLSQRVGAPRASAAEDYIRRSNNHLWDHMKRYALDDVEDGIRKLRNGSLDLLIADTPILDYYRATDHGCKLQRMGETINEDTYAVAMTKGFPLKDSISALISKYSANGYMDILQEKWYGGLPCFKMANDYGIQPQPLGVAAVAGVFLLLGVGMAVGCLILLVEHLFYKYTLPILRHKPKGTVWRSRNVMFFSQKLYRFINCVELVSPHHAARELVHTLRQGQITSLFQKSVKRKEHEQRRRRKSKAQFFEMIQEIRRVQQEERDQPLEAVTEIDSENASPTQPNSLISPPKKLNFLSLTGSDGKTRSPLKSKLFNKEIFKSPRTKTKKRKQSTGGLNVRRFSTDSVFSSHSMLRFENSSVAIGRRLSKDTACLTSSPPDINSRRSSYLDCSNFGSRSPNVSSDSLDVVKKVATIPKYKGKQFLNSSPNDFSSANRARPGLNDVFNSDNNLETKSFQNIAEHDDTTEYPEDTSTSVGDLNVKTDFTNSELHKRHKKTFDELQEHLNAKKDKSGKKIPVRRCFSQQTEGHKNQHQIKIQVEDHSTPSQDKYSRQRHKSLESDDDKCSRSLSPECFSKNSSRRGSDRSCGEYNENLPVPSPRSRSGSSVDKNRSTLDDDNLPPAPPYPNVAPRNSDGKSPLERLSKEELVLLWRSSESELRSHLLTALREKENSDPP